MNADVGTIRSVPLGCRYESVELLTATYRRHVFAKHAHEAVALGVITDGRGSFWCRGTVHEARTGQVVVIPPGETHTGGSAGDRPLAYAMLYLPAHGAPLYGTSLVLTDPALATALRVFMARVRGAGDALSVESALTHALALLGRHCSGVSRQPRHREPRAIRRVRWREASRPLGRSRESLGTKMGTRLGLLVPMGCLDLSGSKQTMPLGHPTEDSG